MVLINGPAPLNDVPVLGWLLDQFLWWEVRSEVRRLLGIEVRNGNGG